MRNLFFITSYNSAASGRDMKCVPSSLTYNRYLISCFEKLPDTNLKVLSSTISRENVYLNKKTIQNGNHEEVYFKSFPKAWGQWIVRFSFLWLYSQLFFYLLFRVKRSDVVVIYNGHGFSHFYKIFRCFLRCKFIYVVAEIFSAVWDLGDEAIKKECSHLMDADGYIFINDIMPRLFGAEHKSLVCYGNYEYCHKPKIKDDIIHVLYAGKISTGIINDAFIALDVIKYLPDNYVMHVAGYGEEADIKELKHRITTINSDAGINRITYEGNLSGEEYENLLAKCRVGLCTRTLRNELSNYCFPSKTMVYLTHDILPICPRVDNLLESKIADRMSFVEGDLTPENIAKAIEEVQEKLKNYNNEGVINTIDEEFVKSLRSIV